MFNRLARFVKFIFKTKRSGINSEKKTAERNGTKPYISHFYFDKEGLLCFEDNNGIIERFDLSKSSRSLKDIF